MNKNNDKKRKVAALERYFFRRPNPNVIMIGRFSGSISPDEFKEAVADIRKAHPMVGSRVRQDEDGEAYFSTGTGPEIDVLEMEAGEEPLLDRARQELKTIDPSGPLVRFVLFLSPDNFDILVCGHHMACDGLSLFYLIRDIYERLGCPEQEVKGAEPVIVDNCLPDGAGLKSYHKRIIGRLNRSWKKRSIGFTDNELVNLHRRYWNTEKGLDILHWKLSGEDTSSMVRRCREENVTVHSALVTAFLLAQRRVQGRDRYLRNISMPVSIRNRLTRDAGEAFGLYYSSFKLEFKFPGGKDFWENARAVHAHIRKNISDRNVFTILMQLRELHPTLVDSISFTRYGMLEDRLAKRFLKLEGGYTTNTGLDLSNIGRLDMPEKVGDIGFREFIGPSVYNEFQQKYMGVLTANGRMCFTVTFCRSRVKRETVEKLRDSAMAELKRAVQ